jgi:tetratricopeptide (TPR) repeat protein
LRDHPASSVLCQFVDGKLSRAESRAVVRHLLHGCEKCSAQIVEAGSFEPGPAEYELPIRRALQAVLRHGPEAPKIKVAARKLYQRMKARDWVSVRVKKAPPLAVIEALLQLAQDLRHENPQEMILCTFAAVAFVRQREGKLPGLENLYARVLMEHANAFRVAGRLPEAEQQLNLAEEWFFAGDQDRELWLRLQDIRASLYGSQQRYDEAVHLLEQVVQGWRELGDRTRAARALIAKGSFTGYTGRLAEAFSDLDEALALIDSRRDPELAAVARHNYIDFLVDAGQCQEALGLLISHRHELLALHGRLNRWKLSGIEGRIHLALGDFCLAESLLREAREGFLKVGDQQPAALATLYLATVVLRQSRARHSEAVTLAIEALQIFTQLQVKPQVIEALNVLAEAIQQGLVTATLLQTVADFVRKAEHDRRARFQPRFE